jgi:hypothetical protein
MQANYRKYRSRDQRQRKDDPNYNNYLKKIYGSNPRYKAEVEKFFKNPLPEQGREPRHRYPSEPRQPEGHQEPTGKACLTSSARLIYLSTLVRFCCCKLSCLFCKMFCRMRGLVVISATNRGT